MNFKNDFNDGHVFADMAYDGLPEQKLDIYAPSDATRARQKDVIVFFYGGNWQFGNKDDYGFVASKLVAKDFIVVIPNYRKYPDVKFPVFVEDGAAATAWTYKNISRYGGNPSRIHILGHSAGAHIGALLTTDERYLKAEGLDSRKVIHDFAGLAGPYSFTPKEPEYKAIFGPPENYPDMQATSFIDGREPPMFLLKGTDDDVVADYNLTKLRDKIQEKKGNVRTETYNGVGHVGMITTFSGWGKPETTIPEDVTEFFRN